MGIFKKLFGRKEGKESVERDQLPPLPDEAFIQEVSDTCTFNTKTKEMKVSLELHDIVLNVPVSTKTYQSPGCRKSKLRRRQKLSIQSIRQMRLHKSNRITWKLFHL